jgi:hypothetical protein
MDEASHFAGFFFVDEIQRVKVLDLGGKGDWEARGIESPNGSHAAGASQELPPDFGRGVAHTAHQTESGDNDSAGRNGQGLLAAFRVLLNVVGGVFDGLDLLGVFVWNLQVEGLLKLHY